MPIVENTRVAVSQVNDLTKRLTYYITIRDNRNSSSGHTVGPYMVAADADNDSLKSKAEASIILELANQEIKAIIEYMKQGVNPLRREGKPIQPRFNSYNNVVAHVLSYFLSLTDPTEAAVAAPLLSLLTDEQLKGLLDIDDLQLTKIRTLAEHWSTVGTDIINYTPVMQ